MSLVIKIRKYMLLLLLLLLVVFQASMQVLDINRSGGQILVKYYLLKILKILLIWG